MFYKRYINLWFICDIKRHLQQIILFKISRIFHLNFYKFGAVIPLHHVKLLEYFQENQKVGNPLCVIYCTVRSHNRSDLSINQLLIRNFTFV